VKSPSVQQTKKEREGQCSFEPEITWLLYAGGGKKKRGEGRVFFKSYSFTAKEKVLWEGRTIKSYEKRGGGGKGERGRYYANLIKYKLFSKFRLGGKGGGRYYLDILTSKEGGGRRSFGYLSKKGLE